MRFPPSVQIKLLRFLQEREFERVGGNETLKVDVRVVAATNRNLKQLVDEGRFREDLYYRLKVVQLDVPPLRVRRSDIPLLAHTFLRKYAVENDRDVKGLNDEALQHLMIYPWPGNVRELENAIERAVVMCETEFIRREDLPTSAHGDMQNGSVMALIPGITMSELERIAILRTLDAVDGSTARAAEILGISQRKIQYPRQRVGLSSPNARVGIRRDPKRSARTSPRLAAQLCVTSMQIDDSFDDRETEAGTRVLCGYERFESALGHFRCDPRTVVDDRDLPSPISIDAADDSHTRLAATGTRLRLHW